MAWTRTAIAAGHAKRYLTRTQMVETHFRIQIPLDEAKHRLSKWWGAIEPDEYIETNPSEAVALAITEDGQWRGGALYFYESNGWSVFVDLSGGFGGIPATKWLEFTNQDAFVFAGYNDSIPYGELIVIEGGVVKREFIDYPDEPEENKNEGQLLSEKQHPIASWIEVASFVDDDPHAFSEKGWLWVNECVG